MPKGTSKGTNANSAGCPKQYIKLKKWILAKLPEGKSFNKRDLSRYVKAAHPELWLEMATDYHCSVDFRRLFDFLGITLTGSCKTCGGDTFIFMRRMAPSTFCSATCAIRTEEFRERKEASRSKTRKILQERQRLIVRPEEYPTLRNKILRVLSGSAADVSRTQLRYHVEEYHPDLYKDVQYMTRGIDVDRLYRILDIPTKSKCLECGNKVSLLGKGLGYNKFCSTTCKATYHVGAGFKYSVYTGKDGVEHKFQGYEGVVLARLDNSKRIRRFTTGKFNVPKMKYRLPTDNLLHTYHPDILAEGAREERYVIEVKSTYTLDPGPNSASRNRAKFKAATKWCEANGYVFWLALVRGDRIEWIEGGRF